MNETLNKGKEIKMKIGLFLRLTKVFASTRNNKWRKSIHVYEICAAYLIQQIVHNLEHKRGRNKFLENMCGTCIYVRKAGWKHFRRIWESEFFQNKSFNKPRIPFSKSQKIHFMRFPNKLWCSSATSQINNFPTLLGGVVEEPAALLHFVPRIVDTCKKNKKGGKLTTFQSIVIIHSRIMLVNPMSTPLSYEFSLNAFYSGGTRKRKNVTERNTTFVSGECLWDDEKSQQLDLIISWNSKAQQDTGGREQHY